MNFDIEVELGWKTRRILKRIANGLEEKKARAGGLQLIRVVLDTGQTIEGVITKMVLTDTQKATLTFGKPLDSKGFPAKVQEGSVTFSISDDSALVTQDPNDPFSAEVSSIHPTPEDTPATITISADADLGDGVKTITGLEPLIVLTGEALAFGPATVSNVTEQ